MHKITNNDLKKVKGGISVGIAVTIAASAFIGVAFIASVIYGFVHPTRCN